MTDDEVRLWSFVIENFHCIPRQLKERITAVEWRKLVVVYERRPLGADRRDRGLALAARQICGAQGKDVPYEDLLPVKPDMVQKPQQTVEGIAGLLDSLAVE